MSSWLWRKCRASVGALWLVWVRRSSQNGAQGRSQLRHSEDPPEKRNTAMQVKTAGATMNQSLRRAAQAQHPDDERTSCRAEAGTFLARLWGGARQFGWELLLLH